MGRSDLNRGSSNSRHWGPWCRWRADPRWEWTWSNFAAVIQGTCVENLFYSWLLSPMAPSVKSCKSAVGFCAESGTWVGVCSRRNCYTRPVGDNVPSIPWISHHPPDLVLFTHQTKAWAIYFPKEVPYQLQHIYFAFWSLVRLIVFEKHMPVHLGILSRQYKITYKCQFI